MPLTKKAKTLRFEQIRVFLRQAQEPNIVTVAERSRSNPCGNSFDGRLGLWYIKSGNAQVRLVVSTCFAKLPLVGKTSWRLIFYSLTLPLRQERATKTVLITVATQVTKPMIKSTVIRTPFSSIISKRNYTRVLLAKLGKQAIACDETNRLKLRHFLEIIIPCYLYSVNIMRL